MDEETMIEVYLPDKAEIKKFHSLSAKDKLLIIKMGLLFMNEGVNHLQSWNNVEWEKRMENIREIYECEKSSLKVQIETKKKDFDTYSKENKERQERLISEIRENEKKRYEQDIKTLEERNSVLTTKIEKLLLDLQNVSIDLDAKYSQRVTESRDFYETKLASLQEKYDNLLSKGQNSTIKGKEGEEYVFGQVNMLFPRAEVEDTHKIPHRGDFILKEEDFIMMIETKNYSKNVQKSEVDKFYRDIDNPANNDIKCAVFVSLHTGICCKDDFSFEIRNMIPILFIHKLNENFTNLVLAVKFFKLILDQSGLDLSDKSVLDGFKNLASTLKRNLNKQRTKLDKYHADQMALITEQECRMMDLYKLVKQNF